jgi:DeoR/GlpR family transcriptional regulator of sugar metabolism
MTYANTGDMIPLLERTGLLRKADAARVRVLLPKIHPWKERTTRHKNKRGLESITSHHWKVNTPERIRKAAQQEILGIALRYLHEGDVLQLTRGATPESLAKEILAPPRITRITGNNNKF